MRTFLAIALTLALAGTVLAETSTEEEGPVDMLELVTRARAAMANCQSAVDAAFKDGIAKMRKISDGSKEVEEYIGKHEDLRREMYRSWKGKDQQLERMIELLKLEQDINQITANLIETFSGRHKAALENIGWWYGIGFIDATLAEELYQAQIRLMNAEDVDYEHGTFPEWHAAQ